VSLQDESRELWLSRINAITSAGSSSVLRVPRLHPAAVPQSFQSGDLIQSYGMSSSYRSSSVKMAAARLEGKKLSPFSWPYNFYYAKMFGPLSKVESLFWNAQSQQGVLKRVSTLDRLDYRIIRSTTETFKANTMSRCSTRVFTLRVASTKAAYWDAACCGGVLIIAHARATAIHNYPSGVPETLRVTGEHPAAAYLQSNPEDLAFLSTSE